MLNVKPVNPGKWVEHEGRYLRISPVLKKPLAGENNLRVRGLVYICPHYEIPNLETDRPDDPHITWLYEDTFGETRHFNRD